MDDGPPGSSVHGFPRKEHWSGLPFLSPKDLSNPEIEPTSHALQADSLLLSYQGSHEILITYTGCNYYKKVLVTKSCLTLCDPMDCSSPGSSVHGISQARIVEWVAISSSRDLPNPGIKPVSPASPELQVDSLLLNN